MYSNLPISMLVPRSMSARREYALVLVGIAVAKNFGKSDAFGIGLGLLAFIFYPILGFGDSRERFRACQTSSARMELRVLP